MIGLVLALLLATTSPAGQANATTQRGDANFALPKYGSNYLAMRLPRGTSVRICGDGGCKQMKVTDFGPKVSTGDLADISLYWFARVCGYYQPRAEDPYALARNMGECRVTIRYGSKSIPLPSTDVVYWSWPGGGPR